MTIDSSPSTTFARLVRDAHSTDPHSDASATYNGSATSPDYSKGLAGVNLFMDQVLIKYMFMSMLLLALAVLGFRVIQLVTGHIRHVHCLDTEADGQKYWSYDRTWWVPWVKREIIYAPLGKKRHNREVQLSKTANYGTIPGRIHTVVLVLYTLSNVIYCAMLPYGQQEKAKTIAELRGRSGVLAVANMIPLMLLATRNNPLIKQLKISFDTFNLFHRWIGRIVVAEALVHVGAWFTNYYARVLTNQPVRSIMGSNFLIYGTVSAVAMVLIVVQSLSPIRHAFYETFLLGHQILAAAAIGGVYIHLDIASLPARPYIRVVVIIWVIERILRLVWLIYLNIGWKRRETTKVMIEALPGAQGACRVTFHLPRHTIIRPGSHAYVYLPKYSGWQSHPFSIGWTNPESEPPVGPTNLEDNYSSETSSMLNQSVIRGALGYGDMAETGIKSADFLERQSTNTSYSSGLKPPTSMAFICAAREGVTRKIYNAACKAPSRTIVTTGFVEGPYAGHDNLASYGTVFMFAGGAGITHHLVQIRHLIASAQNHTVATRRIVLAWSVRDLESLTWVQPWMDEIMKMPGRREMLTIKLFVTKPRGKNDYVSPSRSIELQGCRCDPGKVLDEVLCKPASEGGRVGAAFVSVCGPGAFADEVRSAVRSRIKYGTLDMNEESFTW